jgi:hypothetical protein
VVAIGPFWPRGHVVLARIGIGLAGLVMALYGIQGHWISSAVWLGIASFAVYNAQGAEDLAKLRRQDRQHRQQTGAAQLHERIED